MDDPTLTEKYIDMLIQHSEQNETKLGANSDSVAYKLELLKPKILKLVTQLEKYQQTIDEINKQTFHAGCMGNPNCQNCRIRKTLNELTKNI